MASFTASKDIIDHDNGDDMPLEHAHNGIECAITDVHRSNQTEFGDSVVVEVQPQPVATNSNRRAYVNTHMHCCAITNYDVVCG